MRPLDYILEFFASDRVGEDERVERLRLRAVTIGTAERHARAYLKNVLINNRRIDRCVIASQAGVTIKEIVRGALTRTDEADSGDESAPIADKPQRNARTRSPGARREGDHDAGR